MKKLILSILFILCLSFQTSAWNPTVVLSGSGSCTPETYEFYWNGDDFPADRDTAKAGGGCSSNLDGTLANAEISTDQAYAGTYSLKMVDGTNDYLCWDVTAKDIIDSAQGSYDGYVYVVNDDTDSAASFFEAYNSATNRLNIYVNADRTVTLAHKSNDAGWSKDSTATIAEDGWVRIKAAWDVAGNLHSQGATIKLGIKVGVNAWEYGTATTAAAFNDTGTPAEPTRTCIGEREGVNGDDVTYIDEIRTWVTTDES